MNPFNIGLINMFAFNRPAEGREITRPIQSDEPNFDVK